MGLFDKLKGKKETVDWSNAYTATPKFYGKPDSTPFGAIALTEGTETVLPKTPQNEYRVDGIPLTLDTLEIKIYITIDNPMGVGDKGIFGNQMKSVVGEVMNYDVKTEAGESIDAIFGFKSIYNRIVLSPILMGTSATLMNVIAKKAINLYKKGK